MGCGDPDVTVGIAAVVGICAVEVQAEEGEEEEKGEDYGWREEGGESYAEGLSGRAPGGEG